MTNIQRIVPKPNSSDPLWHGAVVDRNIRVVGITGPSFAGR